MARIPGSSRFARLFLLSMLFMSPSISVLPAEAHQQCAVLDHRDSIVSGLSIAQSDGGAGSDAGHRRMKVDASMTVNERHCWRYLQVTLRKWNGRSWEYGKSAWMDVDAPNGQPPGTYSMHPKFDLPVFEVYSSGTIAYATSIHEKGHEQDDDGPVHSHQCSATTPGYLYTAEDCGPSPSPLPDLERLDTSLLDSAPCARILWSQTADQPPYGPGMGSEYGSSPLPTVDALTEATYSIPAGVTVVSVQPEPAAASCDVSLTTITLDDGTKLRVGPGLSEAWNFDPVLGEVRVVYCGILRPCTF